MTTTRSIAARGQNPPGIRTAMHPRWPLRLAYPHCKAHITLCHVRYTCCRSKASLCVAPQPNSAAIGPSSRLASPAPRRSRCSGGFIHGLIGAGGLIGTGIRRGTETNPFHLGNTNTACSVLGRQSTRCSGIGDMRTFTTQSVTRVRVARLTQATRGSTLATRRCFAVRRFRWAAVAGCRA